MLWQGKRVGGCGQKGAGPAEGWCSSFLFRFGFPPFLGISHLHHRPTGGKSGHCLTGYPGSSRVWPSAIRDRGSFPAASHQKHRWQCWAPSTRCSAAGPQHPGGLGGPGYNNSEAPGACREAGAGDTLHAPLPDAGRLISGCPFPCSSLFLSRQGGTIPQAWLRRY